MTTAIDVTGLPWNGLDPKDRTPNEPAILVTWREVKSEYNLAASVDATTQGQINWFCKHAVENGGWSLATQYGNQVLLVANVKLSHRELE